METRTVLDQQKSKLLLLDFSHELPGDIIDCVIDCLLRSLSLTCVLPGPPRIPLFGIVCAGTTVSSSGDEV